MSGPTQTRGMTTNGVIYGKIGAGPPVVLLHGWCLSRGMWMYAEESLRAHNTVITPDLPGFGDSAALAGPYVLERYATAVLELLEELKLEKAVLVGFAFGAAVAMTAAARDDTRIGGLALIGVPSAAHAAYDKMPRAMRRDWPEFARRSAIAICKGPVSDASLAWLASMFASTPLPVALETGALLGEFEPVDIAADVHVRSLFFHGEHDDVVPSTISQQCADRMTNARVEIVPGAGHLVPIDRTTEFGAALRSFLDEPVS
jgi:non-heme chloroperoxidase